MQSKSKNETDERSHNEPELTEASREGNGHGTLPGMSAGIGMIELLGDGPVVECRI